MSPTPANTIPLGTAALDFTLLDTVSHKKLSLAELKSPLATVIMFICNHCPYVKHIQIGLAEFAKKYQAKNISFIAISANDITDYPEDAPEHMQAVAKNVGFPFPYLYDETQIVAKAYQAACTPDFYVFDKNLRCVYHGQYDDSRPKNDIPVTGASLGAALDNILSGKPVDSNQKPSIGCSIKWRD